MNIDKVVAEIRFNCMADPFAAEVCRTIEARLLTEKSEVGKLLRHLLEKAEAGDFK